MKMKYQSNKKEELKALSNAEKNALELVGAFIEGEAVLRCPVDTGNLRSSITHRVNTDERSVIIGTPVEYSSYVELGTSKQRPQPFLRPAAEDNVRQIESLVKEALKL